jgi:multidrug resistance efflux pump
MRRASLLLIDAGSIRTIGKSANNIADLVRMASRRQLMFAAGTFLVGGTAYFAGYWLTFGRYIESTDDAYVGGEVTTLSFKVAGLIETVAIVDNQSVKAGDLLLKLDDRDYRAQLARTEANIAARRAALANVDATRRMRLAMLEQAMADLAAAMAEGVRAKYDIDRYRTLNNERFASRQRFEQADADHEKARAGERKGKGDRIWSNCQLLIHQRAGDRPDCGCDWWGDGGFCQLLAVRSGRSPESTALGGRPNSAEAIKSWLEIEIDDAPVAFHGVN